MTMLAIDGLTIAFRRTRGLFGHSRITCLADVATSVAAGEVLAAVGASGAGKSLLAHAILGILPPNAEVSGRMAFDGMELTPARQVALRGRRLALVPQSVGYLDPLVRAGRQVAWAAGRAGIANGAGARAAAASMARYGLDARVGRAFPHMLSDGMARRVLLAVATVGDADLVVADEPTAGLDAANVAIVLDHLRALADRGRAVLVITHDIPSVLRVADRITVLREGRTVETAPAAAFAGDGRALSTGYARALWQALPQNLFTASGAA